MNPNDRCIAHLQAGGIVLTRDRRQARILRRLHERAHVASGQQLWPTAQVLPLESWLAQQWREAGADRADLPELLLPMQANWSWRRQVGAAATGLLDPGDVASAARASWLRLRAYGGDLQLLGRQPLTADQHAFLQWASATEHHLAEAGLADAGDLPRLSVLHRALPAAGPSLLLAGWQRLAPAQQALVDALRTRGWQVELHEARAPQASVFRHVAADPDAERESLLSWLRTAVEEMPEGLHAAIIPGLGSTRGAVERSAAAILQPALELPGGAGQERVFDLAGGIPLVEWPVVSIAFDLLACTGPELEFAVLSRLLRNRNLVGADAELTPRTRLDLQLRDQLATTRVPRARAIAAARSCGASQWADALQSSGVLLAGPRRRGAGGWAECFGQVLACWGWPVAGKLASGEYQAAEAFGEMLRALARIDRLAAPMGYAEALSELRRLALAPFQPERGEPAVFLLDALDVPGVWLDRLWVSGLTAAAWPRPAAIDPFIPVELQRSLAMPGSSAEETLAEARAISAGWIAGSGQLVLSWPRRDNDADVEGTALLPAGLGELEAPVTTRRDRLWYGAARLEEVGDDAAPPLGEGPARGGARILELQARCPFRAFAELRLAAGPLLEPRQGVLPQVRGRVLHRTLEHFWRETSDSATLGRLAPAELDARLAACVDEAIGREMQAGIGERSLRLERDWQLAAAGALLEVERRRPPFTVAAAERELVAELGRLPLRVRMDRVDRVAGRLLVIDYKTGKCSPTQWRGTRPDAPQLPLYAVLQPEPIAGVAFAAAGAGRARFVGVAEDPSLLQGLQQADRFEIFDDRGKAESWQQITGHWHSWLESLAVQYRTGSATVDPKLPTTCRGCHLGTLCRVGAGSAEEAEDED